MNIKSLQNVIAMGATLTAFPCLAAELQPLYNLHPNFPTEVTDAYPVEYQSLSAFGIVRYDRAENDRDDWLLQPEVRYGFAPQWEANVAIPFREGDYKGTTGGNIRLGALYQFLAEEDWWPALAVGPQAEIPTGRASRGVDIALTLAASKSLDAFIPDARGDAVHFNYTGNYNMQSRAIERDYYYRVVFGYSREIYENLVGVADFVHQTDIIEDREANLIEAGVIYKWFENLSVAGGLGFGIGAESPDFRATTGVQYRF